MTQTPLKEALQTRYKEVQNHFCLGIDPDFTKLPEHLKTKPEPLYEFGKEILEQCGNLPLAIKPNIAFYEAFGSDGILQFEKTLEFVKKLFPTLPILADCKRGDLANTAKEYAKYFFDVLGVSAVTISPYMGKDSIVPFLEKGSVYLLCLTSNPSSSDLQRLELKDGMLFYEKVIQMALELNDQFPGRLGLVVGATHPKELGEIHRSAKELPLLIPGYGAQGGDLNEILGELTGELFTINSSRSVIFASSGLDYASIAKRKVLEILSEMKSFHS